VSEETVASQALAMPDAQAETYEETPRGFPVEMGNGVLIHVAPQTDWPFSAMEAFRMGDWNSWAEAVLSEDDLGLWDEWIDTDPRGGDLYDFAQRLGKVTGLSAMGNRASRRSSGRTQRR
jgi:hypothetical protein